MANTRHDSTASSRSEELLLPDGPDKPGCAPRFCTPTESACQETAALPLPLADALLSSVRKAVATALEALSRPDGATVSLRDGNLAGQQLFAVAVYPERTVKLKAPPTGQELLAFVIANLGILLRPGHALGIWFNKAKGVHELDIAFCTSDLEVALRLAARFGQSAIYDLAAGCDIPVQVPQLAGPEPLLESTHAGR